MCKIYIKKRIYVYKYIYIKGLYLTLGIVAYLLGNLNERFLQKQKRDKEGKKEKKNVCIKTYV